ncbi:hypothetical protein FM103_18565 [Corynebacterium xerosis]|nr:hypothetical protein FM103_18565 [Corynebacterium xerosis]
MPRRRRRDVQGCGPSREPGVVEVVHGRSEPHRSAPPPWSSTTHWWEPE